MERDYYTTEEAAERLGVTVGRVRQMIVNGLLPTERFGRAHMISQAALKAAGQRRTKPGPAPKVSANEVNQKKSRKK
jgi:excisionase family DNA binding protein